MIKASNNSTSFLTNGFSKFSLNNLAFPIVLVGLINFKFSKSSQILNKVVLPIPEPSAISDKD
ncbi:hypothetical protein HYX16_00025 [Candidatus Woesearchaeota archaeon]|nr:hypothetical protein [Candidatus Woesearchaeota archaeon]